MSCTLCVLHKTCKTVQMRPHGSGRIVFLGEAPGEEEDNVGVPFSGRSGIFLRKLVHAIGLTEEDVRFTNSVRCRPPGNKTPTGKMVKACQTHLIDEFLENPPEVVIPLGNVALDALRFAGLLTVGGKITNLHAKEIVTEDGLVIFPMLHPAYILRNPYAASSYSEAFNKLQTILVQGPSKKSEVDYFCTDKVDELRAWLPKFKSTGMLAYDIETSTLHPVDTGSRMLSFAVSWEPNHAFGFVYTPENFEQAFALICGVLEDESVIKVIQNAKFELMWSMHYGRAIKNIHDTMLIHWHVDETNKKHGLKTLALEYTDMGFYDGQLEDYKSTHPEADPEAGGSYAAIPTDMLIGYNCCDADATLRVYKTMRPMLNEKQWQVHTNIQIPAAYSLATMELHGVKVDTEYLDDLSDEVAAQIEAAYEELHNTPEIIEFHKRRVLEKKTGLNFNSPAQMSDLLFNWLKLPPLYYTDSGKTLSTDQHVLEYLSDKHPVPGMILNLRSFLKLQSTVIMGIKKRLKPDGCVHTNYGNAHTETGRYNSFNPNLQNIDDEPVVKNIFIPHGNDFMLQADYSQIEVRIMAAAAKDDALIQFFRDGVDVHRYVASTVFGKAPEAISKQERKMAKAVVFGLNYGQSAMGLSEELGLSVEEAQDFMDNFFASFRKVEMWIRKTKAYAQKHGYVETLFGRRRRLPAALDYMHPKHNDALRQAINAPIQGTAADILAFAQGRIQKFLDDNGYKTKIVLTVHDSLIFSIPEEESFLVPIFKEMMEEIPFEWMTVPVVVDMELGKRWGELYKLESDDFVRLGDRRDTISNIIDYKSQPKTTEVANEVHAN